MVIQRGAEPICETTAATPDTQYFSTATNYASIRFAISNIVAGPGSVASPGTMDANTGILNWNAGFHGTLNVESYATGCNGIENPVPGVHTLRIYENADAPLDISYDPLTLPDCYLRREIPHNLILVILSPGLGVMRQPRKFR